MRKAGYEDVFIYVPAVNQILRISEGNGSNLPQKMKLRAM